MVDIIFFQQRRTMVLLPSIFRKNKIYYLSIRYVIDTMQNIRTGLFVFFVLNRLRKELHPTVI